MSKEEQVSELIRTGNRLAAALESQAMAIMELVAVIVGDEEEDTDPPSYLDGSSIG